MLDSGENRIVLDTYAWVEYFKGAEEGKKVKDFIEGKFQLFTPSIVIAELSDKYRREAVPNWDFINGFIRIKTKILILDENIADKAGELKQELRKRHKDVSLADAIVLAHSLNISARILTGDKHFKNLDNTIDISS